MSQLIPVTSWAALHQTDNWKALRHWLVAHESMYPGIEKWVDEKVRPGLVVRQRHAYLLFDDGGSLAGAGVLKDGVNAAKLCHLSVAPQLRGTGVGAELMDRLLSQTYAPSVFLTMPESVWTYHGEFFTKEGFSGPAAHTKQYRSGNGELLLWKRNRNHRDPYG